MQLRVHILTTAGPVRIQSITKEEPGIRSAMCLDGKAVALPVSAAYDSFVRTPTGVIERMTGHAAYRMDVAGGVDDGRSWQLPAIIAHAAQMGGHFVAAGEERDTDIDVYATGEVDRDLRVTAVGHVREKLQALARAEIGTETGPGQVVIMLPGANAADAGNAHVVASVDAAFRELGLPVPDLAAAQRGSRFRRTVSGRKMALAVVAAVAVSGPIYFSLSDWARFSAMHRAGGLLELETALAAASGGGVESWLAGAYSRWLDWLRPGGTDLNIHVSVERIPPGGNCAERAARVVSVIETAAIANEPELCAIEVRAAAASNGVEVGGRFAYWPMPAAARPERTLRGSRLTSGQNNGPPGARSWRLELTERPVPGARLRLVVTLGPVEVRGSQPWYRTLIDGAADGESMRQAARRLARLGQTMVVRDWRVGE